MSTRSHASRPGSGTNFSRMAARSGSPAARAKSSTGEGMARARLHEQYETTVRPALMQEFGYKNPMQVPRLEKIVVNMGVGEPVQDSQKAEPAAADLTATTGQHPVITKSKRSLATFSLRDGMPIGRTLTSP